MTERRPKFHYLKCHNCKTLICAPAEYFSWRYIPYCCWPCEFADRKNLPYIPAACAEQKRESFERSIRYVDGPPLPSRDFPLVVPVVFDKYYVIGASMGALRSAIATLVEAQGDSIKREVTPSAIKGKDGQQCQGMGYERPQTERMMENERI